MMQEVLLCADRESIERPELLGLYGEVLSGQNWLQMSEWAEEARSLVAELSEENEVWVASSEDMDPINLAAALKKERAGVAVYLLAAKRTGSLLSRASAAGIDGVLDSVQLAQRYAIKKGEDRSASIVKNGSLNSDEEEKSCSAAPYVTTRPPKLHEEDLADPFDSVEREIWRNPIPVSQAGIIARSGHMISVLSASGGTGKSTVSALMGFMSQALGRKTLIVDADLQFGDVAELLGVKNPLRIDELLGDDSRVSALVSSNGKPAVLAPPSRVEDSEAVLEALPDCINRLRKRFDVVVVNTGSSWTDLHIQLLESSSNALFLMDQRPTSIRACRRALELCSRCGVATRPFVFAVNRCARNALLSSIDVSCALQGAKVLELQDGGREVGELLSAGLPEKLMEDRNALCLSLEEMLIALLPSAEEEKAGVYEKPRRWGAGKPFPLARRRRKAACL